MELLDYASPNELEAICQISKTPKKQKLSQQMESAIGNIFLEQVIEKYAVP